MVASLVNQWLVVRRQGASPAQFFSSQTITTNPRPLSADLGRSHQEPAGMACRALSGQDYAMNDTVEDEMSSKGVGEGREAGGAKLREREA